MVAGKRAHLKQARRTPGAESSRKVLGILGFFEAAQPLASIDDLAKAYKKANQLLEKFAAVSQKKRPKDYRRYRIALARAIVEVSLCVRKLGFTNTERKRLIDRANKTVDMMRSLDRQSSNLEKKADATRSEEQRKEYRRQSRAIRTIASWHAPEISRDGTHRSAICSYMPQPGSVEITERASSSPRRMAGRCLLMRPISSHSKRFAG